MNLARTLSVVSLLFTTLACAACSGAKREAASLVARVDRYRKAENAQKPGEAAALETVACSDREVCAAKDACVASAQPTVRGLALKAEVEKALDDLHAGRLTTDEASRLGLPAKLDEASHLVDEGYAKLPACDAKVTALRLKYAL